MQIYKQEKRVIDGTVVSREKITYAVHVLGVSDVNPYMDGAALSNFRYTIRLSDDRTVAVKNQREILVGDHVSVQYVSRRIFGFDFSETYME